MGAAAPRRQVLLLGIAALLAGCASAPVAPRWTVSPLVRVDHAGGDEATALYRVGRYHQQRGEPALAAEAFARSIALRPDQLDARNAQAVLLAGQGRPDDAIALLEQLVTAFPGEAQPMNNLGYLYYLQGRPQRARTMLAEALRIDPLHAQARANLARLTPGTAAPMTAATAVTPDLAPVADTASPSRLELVQLAPNEFRLQERVMTAAAAMITPAAAANEAAAQRHMGSYPVQGTTPARRSAGSTNADADTGPIQIVNGNGVPGLGERTRRLLARVDRLGAANADVVNKRRPDQRDTVIEYLPGQRARARLMQAALPVRSTLLPVRALPGDLALRLVLGHDHANATAGLRIASGNAARTAPGTASRTAAGIALTARSTRASVHARLALLTRADQPQRLPRAALLTMNSTAVPHFNQE